MGAGCGMIDMRDISLNWNGSTAEERAALDEILLHEATPFAIIRFTQLQHMLGDYWYWFTLGTLWVSYSGWSDLNLWKQLFRADRKHRATSLMKPSEYKVFTKLPDRFTAYRSHRPDEKDWISYTLNRDLADRWTAERGGHTQIYTLKRQHCLALFLRRGEEEILMLDPGKAKEGGSATCS
jgi:hypothetical protein